MIKLLILFLGFISPSLLVSQITPEWVKILNGPYDYLDVGYDIALDKNGNVFVGGASVSITNGAPDYIVVKYDNSGQFQWSQNYNGVGNYEDNFKAIAVDEEGSLYVTGGSYEGSSGMDYVTLKYGPTGAQEWKSVYSGLNVDNDDEAADIAVGTDGFIYVTGSSAGYSSSMWTDFATIKYLPQGDTVWTARFGGSGMPNDVANAIAVDDSGYVYVAGYTETFGGERYNYATIKYTPDGDTAWARFYNGTGNDEDRAYALAVDGSGNVYVTGASWGAYYNDYATVKYNADGVQQWVARYNGPANADDYAFDLKIDSQGNVYITGYSGGNGYDYATIKYDSAGEEEWVARYNGPAGLNDYAMKLALDNEGNIFVTGYSENAPSPYTSTTDIVTIKYNSTGIEQWVDRYNGPGNYHDKGAAIASDNAGNVYVTGRTDTYGQQNGADIVTIKYATTNSISDHPLNEHLVIYPLPAKDLLHIISMSEILRIDLVDLTGKVIYSNENPGKSLVLPVEDLPGGMYFLKFSLKDGFSGARKVLMAKE